MACVAHVRTCNFHSIIDPTERLLTHSDAATGRLKKSRRLRQAFVVGACVSRCFGNSQQQSILPTLTPARIRQNACVKLKHERNEHEQHRFPRLERRHNRNRENHNPRRTRSTRTPPHTHHRQPNPPRSFFKNLLTTPYPQFCVRASLILGNPSSSRLASTACCCCCCSSSRCRRELW